MNEMSGCLSAAVATVIGVLLWLAAIELIIWVVNHI